MSMPPNGDTSEIKKPPDNPWMTDNPDKAQPLRDTEPTKPRPQPAKVMRRVDWGAKPPKWIDTLETPVNKVVLTWTESEPCYTEEECINQVRELQLAHMEEDGVPDIKHNFLVGGDGTLYEGRGYTRVGPTYPSDTNNEELTGKSIEIAFIQKHVGLPPNDLVHVASDCVAVAGKFYMGENVQLYWAHNGNILSAAPLDFDTFKRTKLN